MQGRETSVQFTSIFIEEKYHGHSIKTSHTNIQATFCRH